MTEKINKKDNYHLIFALICFAIVYSGKYDDWFKLCTKFNTYDVLINPNDSMDQFTLKYYAYLALRSGAQVPRSGMSGLMLQNVLKNPIASPDIIGITGGASLSAVVFIAFFSHLTIHLLPLFAVLGGAVAMMILLVFQTKGQNTPDNTHNHRYFNATLFIAVGSILLITKQLSAAEAYTWLVGSLYGATFKDTIILGMVILAVVPLLFLVIPKNENIYT
ncbi:iron chelate uptake ABC transporter family permease subunit [Staphylococcus aureus]